MNHLGVLFKSRPVDKAKTAANVRAFFKNDVQELQAMAGRKLTGFLSSPNLAMTGSSNHAINGTESRYINAVNADQELKNITGALETCTKQAQKIIIMRFIEGRPARQMANYLCLSESQYFQYQQAALCEYAREYARYGRELQIFKD